MTIDAASDTVRQRLADMYSACQLHSDRIAAIDWNVDKLLAYRELYVEVGTPLQIPWWFIGVIHGLEASFSLERHLHNGDPLTDRTVRVPPGRPSVGSPPFTWVQSATDAMCWKQLRDLTDWSVGTTLERLEEYNGLGYRRRGVESPYLWSFSQYYTKGKYIADSVFDEDAVSQQCGGATLLRRLEVEKGFTIWS